MTHHVVPTRCTVRVVHRRPEPKRQTGVDRKRQAASFPKSRDPKHVHSCAGWFTTGCKKQSQLKIDYAAVNAIHHCPSHTASKCLIWSIRKLVNMNDGQQSCCKQSIRYQPTMQPHFTKGRSNPTSVGVNPFSSLPQPPLSSTPFTSPYPPFPSLPKSGRQIQLGCLQESVVSLPIVHGSRAEPWPQKRFWYILR